MRFLLHATPQPDDVALSPLTDSRLTSLELRDAVSDDVLAQTRIDPVPAGGASSSGSALDLSLGSIQVLPDPRDVRMLALGDAGQQVLGMALRRGASWQYGQDQEVVLELRKPLFFFGGSPKLVAPTMPSDMGMPEPSFAPNQQINPLLRDETKLRVIDPNAITPLLSSYDMSFDVGSSGGTPVAAAAGTYDGQSLLVASLAGNLHVVDTLRLEQGRSIPIGETMPVQSIVIDPTDKTATLLLYQTNTPPTSSGVVGRIIFVRDLAALRNGSGDGRLIRVDVDANSVSPVGAPISATYAPDGLIDVVIAAPPLQLGQPDCTVLDSNKTAVVRRYDPQTGMVQSQSQQPYTTSIAYTTSGAQVLAQPCSRAPRANRPGQVVIHHPDNSSPDVVLAAPGTAALAVDGESIMAIGSADDSGDYSTPVNGAVRILQANATTQTPSEFTLDAWEVPYRISQTSTSAVDLLFMPTDVLVYGISVNPDRTRALVLMRVSHQIPDLSDDSYGLYLFSSGTVDNSMSCFVQWSGYTYHVLLINLQNATREQDYLVGVQNQSCSSTFRSDNPPYTDLGVACFAPCDGNASNPYLIGYQDGYIPGASSVLFGPR